MVGVGLARERTDDLANTPSLDERGDARFTVAGIVADDSEVTDIAGNQTVDQFVGHPGRTEPANQDRCTIADPAYSCREAGHYFVDHHNLIVEAGDLVSGRRRTTFSAAFGTICGCGDRVVSHCV